ncbi:MAG TPA: glutamate-5-semialdehyde dehydrogenase [Pseudoxanthomonas sp.]|nr:glutamate-5-semialdehyde dehydrogenase [Pseudoxanthomonas sp.]
MNSGMRQQALACREASQALAQLSSAAKAALLDSMASALEQDAATILTANNNDMRAAAEKGIEGAMLDRLRLDPSRLSTIAAALREVAALPDPVGQITRRDTRPNGIVIERVRVPLGVIAMIYEARPNVTADAAALCLKAGNGVILRGGSEAICSNTAIATSLKRALREAGLPDAALTLVTDLRRETMLELLQLTDIVDLAIPRGGEGLIRFVAEHARVPVIKHYKGVCHLFVDASADLELALRLLVDGKVSRPSACNSLETLLVHADVADEFLPMAAAALSARGVELRADERSSALMAGSKAVAEKDYATEFLDLVIAVRVVAGLDQALDHIRQYGSDHTEVIATGDQSNAEKFVQSLRSAVVMVNASSRFSDGGELGLGAEIGISTTRLHAYGPMGLEALTVERFVVRGTGQTRNLP